MPIENYGVLKGRILDGRQERYEEYPHYQILIEGKDGTKYRAAVNVMSRYQESEILYLGVDSFQVKNENRLKQLSVGITPIPSVNKELGIDYIREDIRKQYGRMILMPHNKPGPANDLNDLLHAYIKEGAKHKDTIYVFGSHYGPEKREDPIFDFYPMQGIHNVHMNQGNKGKWKRDNGIWQDGAILIEKKDRWIAIFLAFLTQTFHTDEEGNPLK